jgi:hypothetical protein
MLLAMLLASAKSSIIACLVLWILIPMVISSDLDYLLDAYVPPWNSENIENVFIHGMSGRLLLARTPQERSRNHRPFEALDLPTSAGPVGNHGKIR